MATVPMKPISAIKSASSKSTPSPMRRSASTISAMLLIIRVSSARIRSTMSGPMAKR